MIPSSSLEKTCASKNHNNLIYDWFDDLIDLLICLADHGSCKSIDLLVTLYMWPRKADSHKAPRINQTWFMYDWMNWSTDFMIFMILWI